MLQTIRIAIFISILFSVPFALGQRPERTPTPDFYVHINARRAVFYSDEYVDFKVMKRAASKASPNCDFGGSGTIQVLRNGNVTKSFTTGQVSMLGNDTVRGLQYVYFGWGLGPYDFLDSNRPYQIGREETFQFRAICGGDVSEPSKPFHLSEWREPVDGLQVLVTPLQKTYKVGAPIRVRVTMRNIGATPKRCPVPFPEDAYPRSFWALEPHWVDSRPPVDDKLVHARGLRTLKPRASRTAIFVLNHFKDSHIDKNRIFGSERGKFRLRLSVFLDDENDEMPAKYRANLWHGRELQSNHFEIVIE